MLKDGHVYASYAPIYHIRQLATNFGGKEVVKKRLTLKYNAKKAGLLRKAGCAVAEHS